MTIAVGSTVILNPETGVYLGAGKVRAVVGSTIFVEWPIAADGKPPAIQTGHEEKELLLATPADVAAWEHYRAMREGRQPPNPPEVPAGMFQAAAAPEADALPKLLGGLKSLVALSNEPPSLPRLFRELAVHFLTHGDAGSGYDADGIERAVANAEKAARLIQRKEEELALEGAVGPRA